MFTIIVVVAVVLHQDLMLALASGHPLLNAMCWGKSIFQEETYSEVSICGADYYIP